MQLFQLLIYLIEKLKLKGEKQTNLDDFIDAFDDGTPGSGKFRMLVNTMNISNSKFTYTDYNLKTPTSSDNCSVKKDPNQWYS